mmetsp:Transcript_20851/g.46339  ORF Transcript_20851/g.46339 Transcript_20851/m.46339 type:complete len:85 (-) Transcript_20851:3-257(-)
MGLPGATMKPKTNRFGNTSRDSCRLDGSNRLFVVGVVSQMPRKKPIYLFRHIVIAECTISDDGNGGGAQTSDVVVVVVVVVGTS